MVNLLAKKLLTSSITHFQKELFSPFEKRKKQKQNKFVAYVKWSEIFQFSFQSGNQWINTLKLSERFEYRPPENLRPIHRTSYIVVTSFVLKKLFSRLIDPLGYYREYTFCVSLVFEIIYNAVNYSFIVTLYSRFLTIIIFSINLKLLAHNEVELMASKFVGSTNSKQEPFARKQPYTILYVSLIAKI